MGRDKEYPLSPELELNLIILLERLNKLRNVYSKPMTVTSGYRPGKYNKTAGGALRSAHLTCEACDFKDTDGSLDKFCMDNPDLLKSIGLYLEHPDSTPGWTHLDTRIRNSTVFRP